MSHPEEWLVTETARERSRAVPARTRRRWLVFAVLGAVVAFVLGIALGQALEEGGGGGSGAVTYERTLDPVTVAPPARTVTVSP